MGFPLHPDAKPFNDPRDFPGRCGNCAHHYLNRMAKTYHKCALVRPTGGAGTDTRVRWPACVHWTLQLEESQ